MPGERGGFRPRPVEKRAAFNAGLPGAAGGNGERREHRQQPHLDRPLDLVGNIRTLAAEARANWPLKDVEFNAAWFLRTELDAKSRFALGLQEPPERADFFDTLRIAWQLIAYGELEPFRGRIYEDILTHSSIYGKSITLNPQGVQLLDAMVEALDIPHTPGQATFDISLFSEETMHEKAMNDIEFIPTAEEVRQAIMPKPENIIDAEQ